MSSRSPHCEHAAMHCFDRATTAYTELLASERVGSEPESKPRNVKVTGERREAHEHLKRLSARVRVPGMKAHCAERKKVTVPSRCGACA